MGTGKGEGSLSLFFLRIKASLKKKKSMHLWLWWVFAAARLSSSFGEQELLSSFSAQASHCDGFSCCRARALAHTGCRSFGSWALEHRLSCGARAKLHQGIWDLRDWTRVTCVGRQILYCWATWQAQERALLSSEPSWRPGSPVWVQTGNYKTSQ